MAKSAWSKGRGKLGVFKPLMGNWIATAETEMGSVTCARKFEPVLDGKFVQLDADWSVGENGYHYTERCLFGPGPDKNLAFWSFTSDGKHSNGWLSAAPDIHAQALCFEADMDTARARQVYWPADNGVHWVVERRTKKGWSRFVEHLYHPRPPDHAAHRPKFFAQKMQPCQRSHHPFPPHPFPAKTPPQHWENA